MAQIKISPKKSLFAVSAFFLTAILVLGGIFYYRNFIDVRALSVATIWSVQGTEPKNERIIPFYYVASIFPFSSDGLVPRLEYRRGSPQQFVHAISWGNLKDLHLEVRGPKTPFKNQTADTLRICLTHMIFATDDLPMCFRFRTQILATEMREMKNNTGASNVELRWFEVESQVLPDQDIPRGIYLSAIGPKLREDRYIYVLPKGTLQTWISRAPHDEPSLKLFETLIRSSRVNENLEKNQKLIDAEIQKADLGKIQNIKIPFEKISALSQVQTLLLSKISISPGAIQAFLHLGGTARLLHFEAQNIGRYDLSAQARLLIEGALLYARGIDLKSDATFQLEKLAVEVRGRSK